MIYQQVERLEEDFKYISNFISSYTNTFLK